MIAVLPPEYLPRLSFFALLARADRVVLGDTFQYSRQTHQNRTRFRNNAGAHWVSIPLAGGQHGTPIREVATAARSWASTHRRAFAYDYGTTPYFEHLAPELDELLSRPAPHLGLLTVATVRWIAGWLGLDERIVLASELPGAPATLRAVLDVTAASTLLTRPEQAQHDAREAGIEVVTMGWSETPRRQRYDPFVPDLSALDALAIHGPDARALL